MNFHHFSIILQLAFLSFVAGSGNRPCDELRRRLGEDLTYQPNKGEVQEMIDRGDAECLRVLFRRRKYTPERFWPSVAAVIEKGDWATLAVLKHYGLAGEREQRWFDERNPPEDIKEPASD